MQEAHQLFVSTLVGRRDELARRAAERIVGEIDSYRSLGSNAVTMITLLIANFYETIVAGAEDDDLDLEPIADIAFGVPLVDRIAAHRIAGEVALEAAHDLTREMPGVGGEFALRITAVAFRRLNALITLLTEQHLESQHDRRQWRRRELRTSLVQAVLRNPPDLAVARSAIRELGIEADRGWQAIAALHPERDPDHREYLGCLGAAGRRHVLWFENGRETQIVVVGAPLAAAEIARSGDVAFGVGRPDRSLGELAASYEQAYDAAVIAERRGGGALEVDETRLERFLAGRVPPGDLADELLEPLRHLPDEQAEMIAESLEAYLDGHCSVTAAARHLNLHPQSFRYRLGKLEALFGEQLQEPSSRMLLQVAISRYQRSRLADRRQASRPMSVSDA